MNKLTFKKLNILAVDLNGESSLPAISNFDNIQQLTNTNLGEEDGMFVGYGFVKHPFPYKQQDLYQRQLKEKELDIAVLENEHLKAVFIPSLGGRLWSLFDKAEQKELLYQNPVLRFGNLAIRNAWFSGGVEWNFGMVGHSPFTCSPLFIAFLKKNDGTPVLRMYEFERVRKCVFQMDFYLAEKELVCSIRIQNPTAETVPVYWWSNIAVPQKTGARIIVPADEAYVSDNGVVSKKKIPLVEGRDISYPDNTQPAKDYFWKTKDCPKKYVCQIDENGYGLKQASTSRLQGRKLFVWGRGAGSQRWQDFLSLDGQGNYSEIQAGLGQTQYECLPMPPKTVWTWVETYGAIQMDPNKAHGDWSTAQKEVEKEIDTEKLEEILKEEKNTLLKQKADKVVFSGSGFGALENIRRQRSGEPLLSEHLDFGSIGPEQMQWLDLLESGSMIDYDLSKPPVSYMLQEEFVVLLRKAANDFNKSNCYVQLQLGFSEIALGNFTEGEKALKNSIVLQENAYAWYGLCCLEKIKGNNTKACELIKKALILQPEDISIIKEALRLLSLSEKYDEIIIIVESLDINMQNIGRIQLYYLQALIHTDDLEKAEALLYQNGGLEVADIREAETSITNLWFLLEEKKAKRKGVKFDRVNAIPPKFLDFRMDT